MLPLGERLAGGAGRARRAGRRPTEPSAELQTIRLALIHITGRWIEPTGVMNAQMAAVVAAYQESRGLAVDGVIGDETTTPWPPISGVPDNG